MTDADTWVQIADIAASLCFLAAAGFAFIGALGVARFPDLLTRMHAATKPQTVGLLLALLGLGLRLREPWAFGVLVLIGLFQCLTAPIASHMMGRAAFRAGQVRDEFLIADELSPVMDHEEPRGAP